VQYIPPATRGAGGRAAARMVHTRSTRRAPGALPQGHAVPTHLELPITADRVRALRAGEEVALSGRILTAREAAHRLLATQVEPGVRAVLEGRFVYHCGPVVAPGAAGGWRVVAAGASPSARVEPWEADVIARYGVRGVIGKGGMGVATQAALCEHGAVYLEPSGGLAVTLARRVVRVHGVHLLDALGVTDAIWDLEVEGFPAIVTMDAQGGALDRRAAAAAP
jgi:fumarate hydratase class I